MKKVNIEPQIMLKSRMTYNSEDSQLHKNINCIPICLQVELAKNSTSLQDQMDVIDTLREGVDGTLVDQVTSY